MSLLVFWIFVLYSFSLQSQTAETKIANEYYQKRDYEKAYQLYQKQLKNEFDRKFFYKNYMDCVIKLEEEKEGLKTLEKWLSTDVYNWEMRWDKIRLQKKLGKEKEAAEYWKETKTLGIENPIRLKELLDMLKTSNSTAEGVELLQFYRKKENNTELWARNMSELYATLGDKEKMMQEWLIWLKNNPDDIGFVQNDIQSQLKEKKEQDLWIDKLYEKIYQSDAPIVYTQVLAWMYMQRRDFYNAFIQQKSIDKKLNERGLQLIELGKICQENKNYSQAIQVFDYVLKTYPDEYHKDEVNKLLIETKEWQLLEKYPIDMNLVQTLLNDYEILLKSSRNSQVNSDILMAQARLMAFYQQKYTEAQKKLEFINNDPRLNPQKKAEASILIGDIYLLKNELGEAMITYMKAERMVGDEDMGHRAKLQTAKVNYYDGEFGMAQEHLEILKKATSRKIANDAMDLSLLIKGNLDLDTVAEPMQMYAQTELLLWQHQYEKAMGNLDDLLIKYPGHSLTEEVAFQKGKIYEQLNQYSKAMEEWEKVLNDPTCILADDALYEMAKCWNYKLNDPAKAKEIYKRILLEYPMSIYIADSRKKFYELP